MHVLEREAVHDEVDVHEAAGNALDVPHATARLLALHQLAHRRDIGAHVVPRRGLPHRLADRGLHLGGETRRAGNDAGARQRHRLEGPRLGREIAAQSLDVCGDRPLRTPWTQAEVDLEQRALAVIAGQRRDQPVRQPAVVLAAGERLSSVRCRRARIEIVQQHEVEVGGRGQLAAAELAERDERVAPAAHIAVERDEIRLATADQIPQACIRQGPA